MKETIIGILEDLVDGVDFENETALIDNGILASLDIIQLIGALSDEYDVSIPATEIIPENFNSVAALCAMVERLLDE